MDDRTHKRLSALWGCVQVYYGADFLGKLVDIQTKPQHMRAV
jgi:hypothetical protein